MADVGKFLSVLHSSESVDEVFNSRCSYWCALILFWRFIREGSKIMFDRAEHHFGTEIRGRVYDITGDVTEKYKWVSWDSIPDYKERQKILNEYINF